MVGWIGRVAGGGYVGPDYPGRRHQVDPATGQVIDTGSASQPTEPVTVETTPTTAPPPPA